MDIVAEMAETLLDESVDLNDESAVTRCLIDAGYKSSHINVFIDDAISFARDLLVTS